MLCARKDAVCLHVLCRSANAEAVEVLEPVAVLSLLLGGGQRRFFFLRKAGVARQTVLFYRACEWTKWVWV